MVETTIEISSEEIMREAGWAIVERARKLRDNGNEEAALKMLTAGRAIIEENRETEEQENRVLDNYES